MRSNFFVILSTAKDLLASEQAVAATYAGMRRLFVVLRMTTEDVTAQRLCAAQGVQHGLAWAGIKLQARDLQIK